MKVTNTARRALDEREDRGEAAGACWQPPGSPCGTRCAVERPSDQGGGTVIASGPSSFRLRTWCEALGMRGGQMDYRLHVPGPPLADYVDYLWSLSDAPSHTQE